MNQAQVTIAALREAAIGLIEDLQDGVTVEIKRTGSIMDFIQGKTDVLPLALRIVPEEDDVL